MPAEPPAWIVPAVIALTGFLIGLAKGGLSGLGPLVTPLLTLVMPDVALAVGTLLPMLIVGDLFALHSYWGEWDRPRAVQPLLGGVPGALAGTLLLVSLPVDVMRRGLALFTLFIVTYKYWGSRIRLGQYQPRAWHGWSAGALAGVTSALFNAGGPPYSAYLLLQSLSPRRFVATSVVFFAVLNAVKLVLLHLTNPPAVLYSRVIDLRLLASLWWVFLFIPIGNWTGRRLIMRIDQDVFEALVAGLLVLSSLLLFWQSLL